MFNCIPVCATPAAMTDSLFASAFGASACLYADVLQCDRNATASELRKAYHRRALLFHPDKQRDKQNSAQATLCFQAVSAAYEILMDSGRRALYDATGQLDYGSHSASTKNDDEWTAFFKSVFRDVVTADVDHNDATYRGSDREAADVLKFYRLCKGDLDKVLTCVVCGKRQDKARWARDVIGPAILSGQVERYNAFDQTSGVKGSDSLIDTDDEEINKKRKRIRM
jgi:DnaJ family protein C protein 9